MQKLFLTLSYSPQIQHEYYYSENDIQKRIL